MATPGPVRFTQPQTKHQQTGLRNQESIEMQRTMFQQLNGIKSADSAPTLELSVQNNVSSLRA